MELVKPQDIKTTALFSVEGELDDISGSGQTEAVHAICSGVPSRLQNHFEAKGAGHYGIFAGKRWRDMVYPVVKSFILAHQPKAAPTPVPVVAAPIPVSVAVRAPTPVAPSKVEAPITTWVTGLKAAPVVAKPATKTTTNAATKTTAKAVVKTVAKKPAAKK
jgi:poly(3-hydroxybutyrate) depolymerase